MARRVSFRNLALLCVLVLAIPFSFLSSPVRSAEPKPKAGANAKAAKEAKDKKDKTKDAEAEYYELYKVFADTLDQVERNYVKDVSRRELMEAAIRGVLGKLDPYSNYISPDELSRFKTSVESQFGGIGIQITIENGQLKVLSPLVGSPAYKAGLQAGDAITKIEEESTDNITIDEAVRRLKGEAGTSVKITIIHPRGTKEETHTIPREIIRLDTVMGDARGTDDQWDFMLDREKQIGYIRLTSFSRETARDLQKAMAELQKQGLKGLILDLRFNPGGLLTSAIEISDMFVSEGRIVSTSGRNSPERAWEARKEGTFEGFPIAMLVNRYSASASEIFSACLQDHHRAVIIGERTWGKGSVQNVIELEEGRSALKLTTASYLRPNGHNIHRFPDSKESDEWGVMPDKGYEVKLSDAEMGELVRYRRDRDILLVNHSGSAKEEEPAKTEPSKDEKTGDKSEKPKSPEKSSDTTPSGDKPATDKPTTDKPTDEKPAAEKPAKEKPASKGGFVDRQLQKALDYLSSELARATKKSRYILSMLLLTLETTCDETAAAVITGEREVLGAAVASQNALHERFGGVVPELASRAHVERILPVIDEALRQAGRKLTDLNAIAVANAPGLAGSLLVGLSAAKSLCVALGIPLVAVNHLQAHIYACRLAAGPDVFPCVGLIVSGGHTSLYRCLGPLEFVPLGGTIDDAAGEAFDKVASLLGLPYPGGPSIQRAAAQGNPRAFAFPRAFAADKQRLDFSFSGLKTAVRYQIAKPGATEDELRQAVAALSANAVADLAASFQEAVVDVLATKAIQAVEQTGCRTLCVGGGVAANTRLREVLADVAQRRAFRLVIAPPALCTDNAVMGAIALERIQSGLFESLDLDVMPGLVR